jgi:hypothetical protein
MIKTQAVLFCLWLAASAPALAQPPTDPDPADQPGRGHAVVGGKNLQPRAVPGQAGQSPEAQLRLLQKGKQETPSNEPVVVPHDLYGNPLGGDPGLKPPGLEPPPKPAAPAQPPPRS